MKRVARLVIATLSFLTCATVTSADERLCDASFEDCRTPLLDLINAETQGIDVAFWFMEDDRFATALVSRWKAGVPVRIIMDTDANATYPDNIPIVEKLKAAGIPMREKTSGGIVHWKMMLFAGQNVVEFSSANFSPHAFVPQVPYQDYIDEAIYFSDDPAVVNSFKTRYDDVWTTTSGYGTYANVTGPLVRSYPTFPIDPELNFPPYQNFASRSVARYNAESAGIDAIMFRITDRRHTDALIAAKNRGVPVRLITEPEQYRNPTRLWHSWNVDRLFMAGIAVRHRKHLGHTHEKATLLHGQRMTVFGSSNWTSPSATSQLEHNYFTVKPWFYDWFVQGFERKWNNGAGYEETAPFVPLPPDTPVNSAPSNGAQNQALSVTVKWHAGYWAHLYDIYLGTDPANLALVQSNRELGPSQHGTDVKSYVLSGLQPGTTYYWKVVAKTMALLSRTGPVWNFRTQGGTPPGGGAGDVVLYASKAPVVVGNWTKVADATAAGGMRLANPNKGAAKISSPAASPADYVEMTFAADAGVGYRLWIRGKAESNHWSNDSAFVQFSDSVTSSGAAQFRIGSTSATTYTVEDCSGCGLSGWGWNDNAYGTGVLGPLIYFAAGGTHTIRIQAREDGLSIDQIVLSREKFLQAAPGATRDDGTILAENSGSGDDPPSPTPSGTIVLHAASAALTGAWQLVADATAASGAAAVLPEAGRGKVGTASAQPADFFELTFTAAAGTGYRLWVRGRATGDLWSNDSAHVQFSDSVDSSGNPAWRIGTTASAAINLEDCSGCGHSGWGWEDNGWGTADTLGPLIYFASAGEKTLRVQNREDGLLIDQIVLSPDTYLTARPGANTDDATLLEASSP